MIKCLIRLSKPTKMLNINILTCQRMKIIENDVKCGEIIILSKNYKSSFKFCPCSGDLSQKFVLGVGFLNNNLMAHGSARGMVTGQGDTCIMYL